MVERIIGGWNRGKVATLSLLDVTGAFDKVSHKRLLHNLRNVGMDHRIVGWISSFLGNRTTALRTPECIIGKTKIEVGILQGSPLSPILYLFYNAGMLKELNQREESGLSATGFIDDVGLLAVGRSTAVNCKLLKKAHDEVCIEWTRTHGSEFAPSKYQLLHLSRKNRYARDHPIEIAGTIRPKAEGYVTYLGVRIDSRLKWGPQAEHAEAKAATSVTAMKRISGSVWGASYHSLRKIYRAVAIPQMTYACSVWAKTAGRRGARSSVMADMQMVQSEAARVITGAFKRTSTAALDVEAYLMPITILFSRLVDESTLRLATSPR